MLGTDGRGGVLVDAGTNGRRGVLADAGTNGRRGVLADAGGLAHFEELQSYCDRVPRYSHTLCSYLGTLVFVRLVSPLVPATVPAFGKHPPSACVSAGTPLLPGFWLDRMG